MPGCACPARRPVDHRPVPKDRQVEPASVEGHHLRRDLSDLANEGLDQLFFGPLTDVGCSDGLNLVPVSRSRCDQRTDADDGVIDKFREFVTHRGANLIQRLIIEVVCPRISPKVGNRLKVPDNDVTCHFLVFPSFKGLRLIIHDV